MKFNQIYWFIRIEKGKNKTPKKTKGVKFPKGAIPISDFLVVQSRKNTFSLHDNFNAITLNFFETKSEALLWKEKINLLANVTKVTKKQ